MIDTCGSLGCCAAVWCGDAGPTAEHVDVLRANVIYSSSKLSEGKEPACERR